MKRACYVDLGFACVDTDRQRRRGFPEVVFCQNKSPRQIVAIARVLLKEKEAPLLLTRLSPAAFRRVRRRIKGIVYNRKAGLAFCRRPRRLKDAGIVVVTAGTSDIPVAEEAAATLALMGWSATCLYDVGVAGVHRVLDRKALLKKARVVIVVAGMEGALASLVSGLVACPVIAVPTSCGYGASFEGLAALLTMLNSCSPGIGVVNIDNGFGAGYLAGSMLRASRKI